LLLAWQGPAICFGLNSISYIAVIAGLLMMRLTPMAIERGGTGIQRMREGFQYIRSMPSILMPISLVAFIAVFGLNFNIWIPLLAKKEFSTGADGFGILMSALGLGSLTGALFLAFSSRGARPRQILVTAVILGLAEVTLALFSVVPFHIIFALITLPIMGFAMSTTNAMANTIVQSASAQHMRGRVMSVYMTFFAGTAPLGAFLAGAMADRFGTPASLAFGGTVTVAAALGVAMYFHAWRPDAPAFNLNPLVQSDPMSRRLQAGSRD
jgi:predicted MFS family arabinose efflux permease